MERVGSSARRYAEAAFDIAERDGTIEQWLEQLERAAQMTADERVARVLENPAVAFAERRRLIERALEKGMPELVSLCLLLLRRGRIELLPEIARAFRTLYDRHAGIVEAVIRSALPLDDDELKQISDRLATATGGKIEITSEVDESLIGGVQVRLGDTLIDGSVRGRLERLRARLVAGTI